MNENAISLRNAKSTRASFSVVEGGLSETVKVPSSPSHAGLRRAADMIETVAFDLAGTESPLFVSRLIEIAAELERHSRRSHDEGSLAVIS